MFTCQSCSQSRPKKVSEGGAAAAEGGAAEAEGGAAAAAEGGATESEGVAAAGDGVTTGEKGVTAAAEGVVAAADDEEGAEDEEEYENVIEAADHHGPFVCPHDGCGRSFKRRLPFDNHLRVHQTQEQKDAKKVKKKRRRKKQQEKGDSAFKCKDCGFAYNYEKSYLKHLKVHNIFICNICKENFATSEELNKHIETEHRKRERKKFPVDRELKCETCDEVFASLEQLSSHNIKHHGITGDPCPICGKYLKRSSMRNHIEKVHKAESARKYVCDECGKVYKTKTDLDTHYTKHTGDKQYVCQTCGKAFRFWSGLDDCQRRHNNEMRYRCNWQVNIDKWYKIDISTEHLKYVDIYIMRILTKI